MTEDIVTKLENSSKQLQFLRDKHNQLSGKKSSILETLKKRFGVNSLKEAQNLLVEKEEKLSENEREMKKLAEEIQEVIDKCKNRNG